MSPMGEAISVCRPSGQIIETRQLQRPKGYQKTKLDQRMLKGRCLVC